MIEARRSGAWRNDYEIVDDGRPRAVFTGSLWRGGGTLTVDGQRYELGSSSWATAYTLVDDSGAVVASARRVGRKDRSIDAAGVTSAFRRSSVWSLDQEHVVQGMPTGSIRPPACGAVTRWPTCPRCLPSLPCSPSPWCSPPGTARRPPPDPSVPRSLV